MKKINGVRRRVKQGGRVGRGRVLGKICIPHSAERVVIGRKNEWLPGAYYVLC